MQHFTRQHTEWEKVPSCRNTHACTHMQPFYGPLSCTTQLSRYQKKHSLTHTYPDHQPSFISFLHLLRPIALSIPSSIYVLDTLFVQLLSKFSLVYLLLWHIPLHTLNISSPNHCFLFATHAHTIITYFAVIWRSLSSNPSLNSACNFFYLNVTTHPYDHSHLYSLECHLIFFSYRPGLTFMQHTGYFARNCCTVFFLSMIYLHW